MTRQRPSAWADTGATVTATVCGHACPVQTATNDRGQLVTRADTYPDPDAPTFADDAPELCPRCYVAKMERRPMSFAQMCAAWTGR